jgi:hypothetical protein
MSLMNALTLSKAEDNGAGSLENPGGDSPAPQSFYNIDGDFGLSAYHQPYINITNFIVDLPFGRGRKYLTDANAFTDAVLGGWQIAGINTIQAGDNATLRYTPTAAQQVSGIQQDFRGANAYRPNVIGEVLVPSDQRSPSNYLSRDTVVIPTDPSQPFGNAERNSVRGPMYWSLDLVASKRFALPWSNSNFEFRAEFFNLLNRSNFRAPNANRSAANYGTITATYDPRIIQVGFKVNF